MIRGPDAARPARVIGTLQAAPQEGVDRSVVDDIGSTAKTLPQFPELWAELVATGSDTGSTAPDGVTP